MNALLLLAAAFAADLSTLDGKKHTGEFVRADANGVTLRTATGEVTIPPMQLLQVDLQPIPNTAPAPAALVELTDGSVLNCSAVLFKDKSFELTVMPELKLTVPMGAVASVLLDATDARSRAEWQEFLSRRGKRDILTLRNKDGKLDGVEGTVLEGNESGERVTFQTIEGKTLRPRLNQLAGLVFLQKPGEIAPTLCKVTDTARNSLVAAKLTGSEKALKVTTVAGVVIEYPTLSGVARLDFSKGNLTYLSDLTPAAAEQTLALDDATVFDRYQRDRNLDLGPIRLQAQMYPKGLTLPSRTVLTYDIGGDYKEFRAVLGVDESVTTESVVEVVIEGDGRELFRSAVKRKDKPRPLALDVKGVKQLTITVAAELLDLGNQATLADAKVSK